MRMLFATGAMAALTAGAVAPAQERTVTRGPGTSYPGTSYDVPGSYPAPTAPRRPRWGTSVNGRWWGGASAPGGWAAYRRPARGYVLPGYWNAPRFHVNDWRGYGLSAPQTGYNWVRYYDDAVLVDGRGSVWDVRSGLDWDGRGDGGGYASAGHRYDDPRYDAVTYGTGGGDRAGRDRGRRGPPPADAAVYPAPGYGQDGPVAPGFGRDGGGYRAGFDDGYESGYDDGLNEDGYGPSRGDGQPVATGGRWVSPDGLTTVTTSNGVISGAYAAGGYAPYGTGRTAVTVQTQPVVTTTTSEWVEDRVTYTRAPRKVASKRLYRRSGKAICRC